ncbi:hypothetical protein [Lysobacter sp. Root983]|uniref:hypothetical protein n=1 Tax=Lysobacter sp. Root983 TaxID=1736613 RepID=UPI0012F7D00A|nr:hypothetical protein [Lysobacter sp. Root983]
MSIVKHGTIVAIVLSLLSGCVSGADNESLESRVSRLVDQATKSARAEARAFSELESLGGQAVPYLVGHLGDVRPLAEERINLENNAPDAFEAVRHYGPDTVPDALAAILNQVAGQDFVFVYNGATSREREENRRRWVEWCHSNYRDQAEICSGQ